ncbi:class I SAM-dependent methyltransferase [Bradyrhizobium sp. HKCCYLS1011]|uniref:class I SAM-dependent methyltransferase n=1 Tax=Bradyrhizobium sp. HKCCYLS1011 TaxID=3420733 RepID=UPI003EBFCC78
MADRVSGTEGYAEEADDLFVRYESHPAQDLHRAVLHLMPKPPARVLDIGAGTGRDGAWLAGLGHQVVAVEPTDTLRLRAMALHPSPAITWIDDSLPELAVLRARAESFDLVMLTAVFMHLDADQRAQAMPNIASRITAGGRLIMRLRHGPVPPGRRMFEVADDEIIALAGLQNMTLVFNEHAISRDARNQAAGVTWTTLGFVKAP